MTDKRIDSKPFVWALAVVGAMAAVWAAFGYIGEQRLHNTALWQRWHPPLLKSAPQTATPVEVESRQRIAHVVVQTEKGLYFLTGADYVPAAGQKVAVQANDRWELYLCDEDGSRCGSIHSFCADRVWPNMQRDGDGRLAGCYAPLLATGRNGAVAAVASPPPDRAGQPGGRNTPAPALGMSHPRTWAWRMGLPVDHAG